MSPVPPDPPNVPEGPTAHVDLGAIVRNASRLRARAGGRPLLVAVKADAYGHGAAAVALALAAAGVSWFGVATASEALDLRRAGVTGRILIFGPPTDPPAVLAEAIAAGVDLTVCDAASIRRAASLASSAPGPLDVHLKLDTGMGRLGIPATDAVRAARSVAVHDGLRLQAIWTHLAVADDPARDAETARQLEAFEGARHGLAAAGLAPPIAHAANTAGVTRVPASHYDLVRPGIGVYGYHASREAAEEASASGLRLEPALRLTAPVTFVKRVETGTSISYGATWTASRPTTVATVRIGYADGYPRALSNRARASVDGRPASVAGRVCMDQTMLALDEEADAPTVGAHADMLGGTAPTAGELAALCDTIPYELLVRIGARVERRYRAASDDDARPEPGS